MPVSPPADAHARDYYPVAKSHQDQQDSQSEQLRTLLTF